LQQCILQKIGKKINVAANKFDANFALSDLINL
jgi:hypothetical protein